MATSVTWRSPNHPESLANPEVWSETAPSRSPFRPEHLAPVHTQRRRRDARPTLRPDRGPVPRLLLSSGQQRPAGEDLVGKSNLGFVLAATIPGPADPAPDLFRAQVLQYRDGDRARQASPSISSLPVARRVMQTCVIWGSPNENAVPWPPAETQGVAGGPGRSQPRRLTA